MKRKILLSALFALLFFAKTYATSCPTCTPCFTFTNVTGTGNYFCVKNLAAHTQCCYNIPACTGTECIPLDGTTGLHSCPSTGYTCSCAGLTFADFEAWTYNIIVYSGNGIQNEYAVTWDPDNGWTCAWQQNDSHYFGPGGTILPDLVISDGGNNFLQVTWGDPDEPDSDGNTMHWCC